MLFDPTDRNCLYDGEKRLHQQTQKILRNMLFKEIGKKVMNRSIVEECLRLICS